MILQPPHMASAKSKYSFVNARTGERVTAESLGELRRKGAAILAELPREEETDARTALLEGLGAPSLLRSYRSPGGSILDVEPRPAPLAGGVLLVGPPGDRPL